MWSGLRSLQVINRSWNWLGRTGTIRTGIGIGMETITPITPITPQIGINSGIDINSINNIGGVFNISKRYFAKRERKTHLTKKQKRVRKKEARKWAQPLHSDTNYIPLQPDIMTQPIPSAMRPSSSDSSDSSSSSSLSSPLTTATAIDTAKKTQWKASERLFQSLKLENETWLRWENVEKSLDFKILIKEIESSINAVFNDIYNNRYNNITINNNNNNNDNNDNNDNKNNNYYNDINIQINNKDKAKILNIICKEFNIDIPSKDLKYINSKHDLIGWIFQQEKKNMILKWRRERFMPYNLPDNLIVELPWYYCLGNDHSPWTRPLGKKA